MNKCPYCGGELAPGAQKCRHCGEWVVPSQQRNYYSASEDNRNSNNDEPTCQGVNPYEYSLPEGNSSGEANRENAGFFETYFIRSFFSNYSKYSGYLSRRDFWLSILACTIISLGIIGLVFAINWFLIPLAQTIIWWSVGILWAAILFVPFFGLSTRRLNDAGMQPSWNLVALIPVLGWIVLAILWLQPEKRRHPVRPVIFTGVDSILGLLCICMLIFGMCLASGMLGYYGSNAEIYDSSIVDSVNEEELFTTVDTIAEKSSLPATEQSQTVSTTPKVDSTPAQLDPSYNKTQTDVAPDAAAPAYDTSKYY
ncbi:MAG: DUF805 domain-containing protein [Prevotella sp.]|nr:DUF805 domain-containing protein [Bacteroides sp.]MCM1365760.1 DUF805 domain-containing protein [Prevotella sp.]MCM1436430.1 DUF805 domain-containing protein [Prevotella sp.]